MSHTSIDLERLGTLLDAYGGDPERWPDRERADALALLARSADARRLHEQALRLDAVLDALPAAAPSPELEERIVAAARATAQDAPAPAASNARVHALDDTRRAQARRGARRRGPLLAAALPFAAAAALALWLSTERAAEVRQPATRATPVVEIEIARLGVYETPGDALLDVAVVDDVYETGPWDDCADADLGCLQLDTLPSEPVSAGQEVRFYS